MNNTETLEKPKAVSELVQTFKAARKVSTPILAVRTTDQAATMSSIGLSLAGTPILVAWNLVDGLYGLNEVGVAAVKEMCDGKPAFQVSARPADAISRAINAMPERGILFMQNFHNYLEDVMTRQAVWNLRDKFKANGRTLVLLGPEFKFPADLVNDIVMMDEKMPDMEDIATIISNAIEDAGGDIPTRDGEEMCRAQDALIGLPSFPAEQVASMSLIVVKEGEEKSVKMDIDQLWERKRKQIEAMPGLSVYRGKEKFADIGGANNIKSFLTDYINGKEPPRICVFIDEIEKHMGGNGDPGVQGNSVDTGMKGKILTFMEDTNSTGIIAIGPPGAAKSAISKAFGNEAGIPTVQFSLGDMKNSLVGESEANLSMVLNTLQAMGQGRIFFMATCNSIEGLAPELRRRFTLGTFFFDLPTAEERALIWQIYLKKYNLQDDPATVKDTQWTGAEIKQCCHLAYITNRSIAQASAYVVPVAIAAKERIDSLRREASDRFISASYPGNYHFDQVEAAAQGLPSGRRALNDFMNGDD